MTATAEDIRAGTLARDLLAEFLRAAAAYWAADCFCLDCVRPDTNRCRPDRAMTARYLTVLDAVESEVDDAAAVDAFAEGIYSRGHGPSQI